MKYTKLCSAPELYILVTVWLLSTVSAFSLGKETSCQAVTKKFSVTGEKSKDQAEAFVTGMSLSGLSLKSTRPEGA